MTRGNIIGEDLKPFLIEEIQKRQKLHGRAYNSSVRNMEEINFLSNRNAWIKMGSSVIIQDTSKLVNPLFKNIKEELKGMGLSKENSYLGVIHNLSKVSNPSRSTFDLMSETGIDNNGLKNYGHVPPPGIESFDVKTLNRGSIRKGVLKMKAFSKAQFDVIDFLFFRPGFSVMVEWGWGTGGTYKGNEFKSFDWHRNTILDDFWWSNKSEGSTHLDMIWLINKLREEYQADYDGFFGKVSNFEWTLGEDGVYDITLTLISMGDVVESLNLNIAPQYSITTLSKQQNPSGSNTDTTTTENKESTSTGSVYEKKPALSIMGDGKFGADSNIMKGAGYNQLCNILYHSIKDEVHIYNDEYYNLKGSVPLEFFDKAIDDRYNYFVSFRELMNLIWIHLVPSILDKPDGKGKQIEKLISFDIDIFNDSDKILIPIFPNQIAFDPRVCIFEHKDTIGYNDIKKVPYIPLGLSETSLVTNATKNKKFIKTLDNKPNLRFGILPNLFINYDFISRCFIDKTDEKGNLNLFEFLKTLCDGINGALGNVNKIEPILKDDKIITFIDQTPIPGNKQIREKEGFDKEQYEIDLWGYNTDKENKTSNFVKDFSFKTKISPQMSSQIAIGATANQSTTKTINGTIFSKWNDGLKDKFSQYSVDPQKFEGKTSVKDVISQQMANYRKLEKQQSTYEERKKGGEFKPNISLNPTANIWNTAISGVKQLWSFTTENDEVLIGGDGNKTSVERDEALKQANQDLQQSIQNVLIAFVENDYNSYLIEAFGGDAYGTDEAKSALKKEVGEKKLDEAAKIANKEKLKKEREERLQKIKTDIYNGRIRP